MAEQAGQLTQPDQRRRLIAELHASGSRLPIDRIYELGNPPDYEPRAEDSIAARAVRMNVAPHELLVDLMLADEGRALLHMQVLNYFDGSLDAAAEMLAHPFTVPGLGDGAVANVVRIHNELFAERPDLAAAL